MEINSDLQLTLPAKSDIFYGRKTDVMSANMYQLGKYMFTSFFLARRGRMSSERYCHTPGGGGVIVIVVIIDNFRLKFLFINLSQIKVSVY